MLTYIFSTILNLGNIDLKKTNYKLFAKVVFHDMHQFIVLYFYYDNVWGDTELVCRQ